MMKLLKNIPAFWFIVLPIAITIIVLFSFLPDYLESNVTRITRQELQRSLIDVSRRIEITLRTLMINNPEKVKEYHRLLEKLRFGCCQYPGMQFLCIRMYFRTV